MQLAAFNQNNFILGHAAMLINEGLPLYLVSRLEQRFHLPDLTVGILGMAFKGGSDDPRESLAYKLRKLLTLKAARVLCTDPHVPDPRLLDLPTVLEQADLLIIAAPHQQYTHLDTHQPLIDMWGLTGHGVLI
jgi:UDP-N-acetyl-D-mannosaminuronic acid dehydrogenase